GFISGIYFKKPDITEKDIKVMKGISNQVSTALEQARLYRESIDNAMELSRKIETIQVMNEIDRSILSTLKSNEMLETVTMMIGRLIQCDRATVVLVDKEKNGFLYIAGFGTSLVQKGAVVPFENTSTTEVVKTGRYQYTANLREIKGLLPLEESLLKEGFLSYIRVPLVSKNEIIGVLNLGSKRPSAFTSEDLSTLEKISYQIGVALENSRLITDLEELFMGTVKSLSSAIDAKSKWTAGHSERVTGYAVKIGKEMGMNGKMLKDIELGGLLHDIGKLGTYEAILDKAGGLTDEEYKTIKQHPVKGAEILAPIKQLKDIIPAVRHHHEFYNGKGYPDGLKGEEIPLMARIVCVADSIDAMGADRPYRKGKPRDVILTELKKFSGVQFDPGVVNTFLKIANHF
ncbi:MAG: HD domain-containing phosphohydrolase, partial [Nitrospinota bacterium]